MSQDTNYTNLAERYLTAWNETDPERRRALIREVFGENASYRDPLMSGRGHEEIDGLIRGVQAQFPGHTLRLAGMVDGFGDRARFAWELVSEGGTAVVKATDFVVTEDGRLTDITGFIDHTPTSG